MFLHAKVCTAGMFADLRDELSQRTLEVPDGTHPENLGETAARVRAKSRPQQTQGRNNETHV